MLLLKSSEQIGRYIQEYLLLWDSLLRQDFGGYIGILLPSPFEAL